ncbi:cytochrome P450 [Perilla frutescens var. hirtella]|nr:cytochrome P450 [Perilla frutescens var. hirtella]
MEFPSLEMVVSIISISLIFYTLLRRRKPRKTISYGFKTYPFVGALPDFIRNRHRFLDWTTEVLAGSPSSTAVLRLLGNARGVMTANPLVVEHMLKSNFDNFPRGSRSRALLQDFLGDGIFNSDGELWRTQRKIASHEFSTKSLKNFAADSVATELQGRLIPLLQSVAETGRILNFQDILERFAFDNICKVAFNVDPCCLDANGAKSADFMQAFEDAATLSLGRFMSAFPDSYKIKKFFNLGSERKLQRSIAVVHDFADEIIESRLKGIKNDEEDDDLLSRFIASGQSNSPQFLRDIVISFILAGRDTTSSALSWFFWLLSENPEVEERILKELEASRRRNKKSSIDDIYSFDELRELHYLHAAIAEAMRLYPPVPIDTKTCENDDVLPDGTFIGKDWFITYHAYAMGRSEKIWGSDCRDYKPERWLEDGIFRQESPFKFPVFHAGPRICVGKEMGFIQMKSIAAFVLQRFRLEVVLEEGKVPECLMSLTLRIKGGLPVRVKERERERGFCDAI